MILLCIYCNTTFKRTLSKNNVKAGKGKLCSKQCLYLYRKNIQAPMSGKKHSNKTKEQMSKSAQKRIKNKPHTIPDWTDKRHAVKTRLKTLKPNLDRNVGNYRVGYVNLHKYIRKRFNITGQCQHCNVKTKTQLANKTGKYLRQVEDWLELCAKCHYKYDIENNLFKRYKNEVLQ